MSKYVEIKIKKIYIIIFSIVLVFACGIVGYYNWCTYHPEINILISGSSEGTQGINIEAPVITIDEKKFAAPAASIYLKLNTIVDQHDSFYQFIKDTYETANIELNIKLTDNDTILKYYGTATTIDGKVDDITKEYACGFALEANIEK